MVAHEGQEKWVSSKAPSAHIIDVIDIFEHGGKILGRMVRNAGLKL
jgi:hypothetical protein